jgi:hypothetical protein
LRQLLDFFQRRSANQRTRKNSDIYFLIVLSSVSNVKIVAVVSGKDRKAMK